MCISSCKRSHSGIAHGLNFFLKHVLILSGKKHDEMYARHDYYIQSNQTSKVL